jgi:hypothetical protein
LRAAGSEVRDFPHGHMIMPNGKGVGVMSARGIANHWEVAVDAGYLPTSELDRLTHSPIEIVNGLLKKGWLRWKGTANYETWDLPANHVEIIEDALTNEAQYGGEKWAYLDVTGEGVGYRFQLKDFEANDFSLRKTLRSAEKHKFEPGKALELSLPAAPLKMATPAGATGGGTSPPVSLTAETFRSLANLGALKLLRAERGTLSVADFKRQMVAEYGAAIAPHADRIHADAVKVAKDTMRAQRREREIERIAERPGNEDLSRAELEQIAEDEREERRRVSLIHAEHEKEAKKYDREHGRTPPKAPRLFVRRQPAPKAGPRRVISDALAEAVAANVTTDEQAAAVARMLAGATDAETVALGGPALSEARRQVAGARELAAALRARAATSAAEVDQALAALQEARRQRADARNRVRRQLEALQADKLTRGVGQVWRASKGIPISLMASGDVSNLMRQGGVATFMHPELLPAFVGATLSSVKDAGFARNIDRIENDPDFAQTQRMDVDYAFAGKEGGGEENFEGADVLRRIPVVGTAVRKSDEVFGGGLDHLRFALAKMWIQELRAAGVTYKDNPQAYKDIGRFINIITGRADVGPHNTAATKAYLAFGRMFGFAPRYRLSRVQFLTLPFNRSFWNAPPAARRIVFKNVARWYGAKVATIGAMTALGWITQAAAVGLLDPDDDDWLKFKIGDVRIDLTDGNVTHARLVARMMMEAYRGLSGQVTKEMAARKIGSEGARWLHSGADPRASAIMEWATGETYDRRPFAWFGDYGIDGAIGSRLVPLTASNFVKVARKEGVKTALPASALEFVGVGTQVYPDRADEPKTPGEKLATRFARRETEGMKPLDEETRRKIDVLKGRSRAGENVEDEVAPLVDAGAISEGFGETIINARNQTLLEEKMRLLTFEEAKHVIKYLSPDEVAKVRPILRKKALNEAEKKARLEEERRNPRKAASKERRSARAAKKRTRKQERKYGDAADKLLEGTP